MFTCHISIDKLHWPPNLCTGIFTYQCWKKKTSFRKEERRVLELCGAVLRFKKRRRPSGHISSSNL